MFSFVEFFGNSITITTKESSANPKTQTAPKAPSESGGSKPASGYGNLPKYCIISVFLQFIIF